MMKKLLALLTLLALSPAHSQIKISGLPPAGTLTGAEIVPCVQSLSTFGCLTSQWVPLFRNMPAPSSGISFTVNQNSGAFGILTQAPTGGLASVGIAGNGASYGINSFDLTQSGTNNATIVNRGVGTLSLGTNGNPSMLTLGLTGGVTLNAPSSGVGLTLNSAANSYGESVLGSGLSGQSLGIYIQAGTTSGDFALQIRNSNGTTIYLIVYGDGGVVIGSPTGGDKGPGTLNVQGPLYVNGTALTVP